jgi:hypothetical protein
MNAEQTSSKWMVTEARAEQERENRLQIRSVSERLSEQVLRCIRGGTTGTTNPPPILLNYPS